MQNAETVPPAGLSSAQPWRAAALAAAAIAAAELVLLVVAAFLIVKPFTERALRPAAAREPARASAPARIDVRRPARAESPTGQAPAVARLSRHETSVLVLNGNGVAGAAGAEADRVRGGGYVIASTANAPRSDFARSLVMYRPGFRGEAERLARDLAVERVAPLDGLRATDLAGAHVALVVGADLP